MIPRPYQLEAIKALFDCWRANGQSRPLLSMSTGSGKTLTIALIIQKIRKHKPDFRFLIVSHVKEIVEQHAATLSKLLEEPIGVYSAGLGSKQIRKITVGNIQSLVRQSNKLNVDMLIVDEVHRFNERSDTMYGKLVEGLLKGNRDLKCFGASATCYRMDSGLLFGEGKFFSEIAYETDIVGLINEGFLSKIISKNGKAQVDMSDVPLSGYDYNQGEMQKRFDVESLAEQHCSEIIKGAGDRKSWLIFCSGVEHAAHISNLLNTSGIASDYIHGELLSMERDRRINLFRQQKLRALCNVDIVTTGVDLPSVDYIALLRATRSAGLYVQICGRGLRLAPNKDNCLIQDWGGNISRHGPIDCIHVKAKGKKGKKAEIKKMPVKECPACGSVQSIRVFECSCGYQFPLNTTKLSAVPDTAAILSEPEILDVTWHAYKVHNKPGKPPSFKIEYGSGSRVFYDFLCFEHGGFASDMARKKWMRLCGTTPPVTTIDAVRKSSELPKPGQIKVKKEGEYWRVLEVIADLTPEFDSVKEIGINI